MAAEQAEMLWHAGARSRPPQSARKRSSRSEYSMRDVHGLAWRPFQPIMFNYTFILHDTPLLSEIAAVFK